ncbi:MAG: hypothetical protein IIX71_04545, partial [Ruminococcus sp.]|nr:hypothetical protein [Ruminococcus sp.]
TIGVYILPSKMGVSTTMMILGKGERHTLRAVYDGNKPGYGAAFSSNNGAVSVNAQTGELTANYNGYATITAKSPNGLTAKCYVIVKNAPSAVQFKNRSVKMHLGESVQFYLYPSSDKEGLYGAAYTSGNSEVASVTAGGGRSAQGRVMACVQHRDPAQGHRRDRVPDQRRRQVDEGAVRRQLRLDL